MGEELVYLLQGGPYYKIGRTRNLVKRIKVIQTSHPYPLVVVHTWQVVNGAEVESYLHRKFASVKMNGEWFQLPMSDIETLITVKEWVIEPRQPRVKREPLHREPIGIVGELFERYQLGQTDLTRALDKWTPPISRSYAHYVWHGVKTPSVNVILAIHKAYPDIPAAELLQVLKDSREPE